MSAPHTSDFEKLRNVAELIDAKLHIRKMHENRIAYLRNKLKALEATSRNLDDQIDAARAFVYSSEDSAVIAAATAKADALAAKGDAIRARINDMKMDLKQSERILAVLSKKNPTMRDFLSE